MTISGRLILAQAKIIRVEPTVETVSLTWNLGSRCNYDCMYCPADIHDMTSAHPDLDKLKNTWNIFYNKTKQLNLPYKISFTGGEVTANKSFLPLLEFLQVQKTQIYQIIVSTNGSASVNYYKKLSRLVSAIGFSIHSEFFNEKDFFEKVLIINQLMVLPEKSVHVNIMNEFWNENKIELYKNFLEAHQISYSINKIDYSLQTRDFPIMQGVYNFAQI
jgi:MoaA/NifB/PqqE/SkfB family radical SAM enzyme